MVTAGTDKIGTVTGVALPGGNVTDGTVEITSGGLALPMRLILSEISCSAKSWCKSADLFEATEAVVFVRFDTIEFLELEDASEVTEPLLTVLSGGCSSSGWISHRDNVCVGDTGFSGSKA